ncbi:2Fe-2S iron-sulfur cluster-binding protein [Marinobacter zhejiangensis]|uniref:Ferredoxin n=1 Tax=Marinobacter zhejiangensis TaxID=488535 RepID=A0A1I4KQX0_9GAMM|nr:2Fe-2S iron-sulfur cluster-binding protein [Marinobacter zhejiangensis]SFL81130.1 Ferredoxin [Marinobacter zhejiangensis]
MAGVQVFNRTTGDRFSCEEGQSVLKAMEHSGLRCVPVGCRGGGCGFCKVTVLNGEFQCGKMSKVHVSPECRKRGEVLACRVYPLTDLTIECRPQGAADSTTEQQQK